MTPGGVPAGMDSVGPSGDVRRLAPNAIHTVGGTARALMRGWGATTAGAMPAPDASATAGGAVPATPRRMSDAEAVSLAGGVGLPERSPGMRKGWFRNEDRPNYTSIENTGSGPGTLGVRRMGMSSTQAAEVMKSLGIRGPGAEVLGREAWSAGATGGYDDVRSFVLNGMGADQAEARARQDRVFKLMQEDVGKRYDTQLDLYRHEANARATALASGRAAGLSDEEAMRRLREEQELGRDATVLGNQGKRLDVLKGVQEVNQEGRWAPKPDKTARVVSLGGRDWIEDANGNLRPTAEPEVKPEFITDPMTGQRYARYGKELTQQRLPGDEPSKAEYDALNEYSLYRTRADREPGNADFRAAADGAAKAFKNLFGRHPDEPRRRQGAPVAAGATGEQAPAPEVKTAAPEASGAGMFDGTAKLLGGAPAPAAIPPSAVEVGKGKLYALKTDEKTGAQYPVPAKGGMFTVAALKQMYEDGVIDAAQAKAQLEQLRKAGLTVTEGGAK